MIVTIIKWQECILRCHRSQTDIRFFYFIIIIICVSRFSDRVRIESAAGPHLTDRPKHKSRHLTEVQTVDAITVRV